MKLATKLVMTIVLCIIAIVAIDAVIMVRRAVHLFEADMRRDADVIARVARPVVENAWQTNGIDVANDIVAEMNQHDLSFRLVLLDPAAHDPDDQDDSRRPHVPSARLDPVRAGEDGSLRGIDDNGRECLFTYAPLSVSGQPSAALELAEPVAPINTFARSVQRRVFALAGVFVVLGTGVVLTFGIYMVGRPLQAVVAKVRRAGKGDLEEPLVVRGHDELAELGRAINSMCESLASSRERLEEETSDRVKAIGQLRHADRLATVGTLASGVAHELGTPLNVVSGRASLIARGSLAPDEVVESAEIIRNQTARMTVIIRQLLDFARRQAPARSIVSIPRLLHESAQLLRTIGRKSAVEIVLHSDEDVLSVSADPGQLQQVFANLMMNAIQAMPDGGRLELDVQSVHAVPPKGHDGEPGNFLRIDVRDQGCGITREDKEHLFDPFFTTKDVGEGTGLGLSIAYGIVGEHGGWIGVSSEPGHGSCFSVYLPQGSVACPAES